MTLELTHEKPPKTPELTDGWNPKNKRRCFWLRWWNPLFISGTTRNRKHISALPNSKTGRRVVFRSCVPITGTIFPKLRSKLTWKKMLAMVQEKKKKKDDSDDSWRCEDGPLKGYFTPVKPIYFRPFIGVITPCITSRGPPCSNWKIIVYMWLFTLWLEKGHNIKPSKIAVIMAKTYCIPTSS